MFMKCHFCHEAACREYHMCRHSQKSVDYWDKNKITVSYLQAKWISDNLLSPPLFTVSSDPPKLDSRFSSLSVVVVGQIMTGRATPPFTSPPMYTFYCIISYQMCTFNKERDASIQTSKNWTLHPALFCGQKFLGKMDSNLRAYFEMLSSLEMILVQKRV